MTTIIRIPNIQDYIQEIVNGELILTPRNIYISNSNLNIIPLIKSIISISTIDEKLLENKEVLLPKKVEENNQILLEIEEEEFKEDVITKEVITKEVITQNKIDDKEINSFNKKNKNLTINELKEKCKSLGIKGYSKMKKEELIELLAKNDE